MIGETIAFMLLGFALYAGILFITKLTNKNDEPRNPE